MVCNEAKLLYNGQKDRYESISSVKHEGVLWKLCRYVGWELSPLMIDNTETGVIIKV